MKKVTKNKQIKIERVTLSGKVEQHLRQRLQEGLWKEGERLPSEAELAEAFGVSRPTVRMAIQRLVAQGLLITRVGDGIYANKFSMHSYLKAVGDMFVTPEMLDDVKEFRMLLEIDAVRLACIRATDDDFKAMQKAHEKYKETMAEIEIVTEENVDGLVAADINFHYSICKTAHNSLYTTAFNAAREPMMKHFRSIILQRVANDSPYVATSSGKESHQQILEYIKERDFESCKKVYAAHIDHRIGKEEYKEGLNQF